MASKDKTRAAEDGINVEEALDEIEKLIERTKVLYEQYFLGIQKLAPMQLHKDIDRKMRELAQIYIRNTGQRYRLATISQKFGSYNSYWKRTMREIEQGRYIRDVARVGRRALEKGEDIPAEVLHAMPKRMREKILRDREALAKRAAANVAPGPVDLEEAAPLASAKPAAKKNPGRQVHEISEDEDSFLGGDDFDLDQMFANIQGDGGKEVDDAFASLQDEGTVKSAAPPAPRPAAAPPKAPPGISRPSAPAPRPGVKPPGMPGDKGPPSATAAARPIAPTPTRPAQGAAGGTAPSAQRPVPASPPVTLPAGMTDREARELHKRYVNAQEATGEKKTTSYEALMKSLSGKTPKILQDHGASKVAYNVVVKDNKVVLKAKPIK